MMGNFTNLVCFLSSFLKYAYIKKNFFLRIPHGTGTTLVWVEGVAHMGAWYLI